MEVPHPKTDLNKDSFQIKVLLDKGLFLTKVFLNKALYNNKLNLPIPKNLILRSCWRNLWLNNKKT